MPSRRPSGFTLEPFLALLEQRAPRPLTIQQMTSTLELERYDRKQIRTALEAQVENRTLRRIGKTRYRWVRESERQPPRDRMPRSPVRAKQERGRQAAGLVEGRYSRVRAGYGFVEVCGRGAERFTRDIAIPAGMEGEALHGDRVVVEIVRRDWRTRRVVGRVKSVTAPGNEWIIGTLERVSGQWRLMPQSELLPPIDIVGAGQPRRGDAGLVALVQLTRRSTATRGPAGELDKVLGAADDPEVQVLSVAYEHGLRTEFPPEVLAEATQLPSNPSESDFAGRQDLRALPFVTIDGETARDFDDAVCLEARQDGGERLWVAIADVAHYVRPGSALDREAAARGTSVYFPDRAIPMLPPQLSNQLCSLNPDCERLVLVAEMTYDRAGHRHDTRFDRAIIKSRARLTYTQVAAVLSDTDTPEINAWRTKLRALVPQLGRMRTLMGKLYRTRLQAGSLDLDLPEALIDLSAEGRSIGVRFSERNDAHRLIEEFMLEANRAVAAFIEGRSLPFPYRIHEPPNPADIDELNQSLRPFDLSVRFEDRVTPRTMQDLLDQLQGHRLARVLSRHILRSLTQARYSTANAGHFGLAFPIYCHFTSPIRRYPDLLVHRQLGRLFDGQVDAARAEAQACEAASIQSSLAERRAIGAERAMLDLKKAEFMLDHLLEPAAGTIVSVLSFGLFVELDAYPIEGLVRIDELRGDRYSFVEDQRALIGKRTGQRFRLGDRILVEATKVSLQRRQIDFAILKRLTTTPPVSATASAPRGRQQPSRARKRKPPRSAPQRPRKSAAKSRSSGRGRRRR